MPYLAMIFRLVDRCLYEKMGTRISLFGASQKRATCASERKMSARNPEDYRQQRASVGHLPSAPHQSMGSSRARQARTAGDAPP